MQRDTALAIIKRHEADLKRLGVASLSLVGSTARDEATADSDIDVAVRLENVPGGFAYFGRLDDIARHLAAILASKVDVIDELALRPEMLREIDRDRRLAF